MDELFTRFWCVHRDECKIVAVLVHKEKEKSEQNETKKRGKDDAPSSSRR